MNTSVGDILRDGFRHLRRLPDKMRDPQSFYKLLPLITLLAQEMYLQVERRDGKEIDMKAMQDVAVEVGKLQNNHMFYAMMLHSFLIGCSFATGSDELLKIADNLQEKAAEIKQNLQKG